MMKNAIVASLTTLVFVMLPAESAVAAETSKVDDAKRSTVDADNGQGSRKTATDSDASSAKANTTTVSAKGKSAKRAPNTTGMPSVLGFGPGFFMEDTVIVEGGATNGQREPTERDERVSDGVFNLQLWALFPVLVDRVRLGAGLAWYNKYSLVYPDDEDDNNDDDRYEVGHTFQLYTQAEYAIPRVVSKLDVLFGFRAGGIVVFSGRDVQNRLDELEGVGYDVTQLPRFGAFVGPHIGGLWPLNERLSARFDIGVQFGKTWLYDAEAEAGGSLIERSSHLDTTRTMLTIGLEFGI